MLNNIDNIDNSVSADIFRHALRNAPHAWNCVRITTGVGVRASVYEDTKHISLRLVYVLYISEELHVAGIILQCLMQREYYIGQ